MEHVIILLGPPGSGKGTQAKRIAHHLGIPHISTGDLFRNNLAGNTPLGSKVRSFMEAGKLVPDEIVNDMLFDRVRQSDCKNGYLLDGFPRSIPQAEALEEHLNGSAEVSVISLEVPDEEIVKRIDGRRTCSGCGAIYNIHVSPPKIDGVCDQCGGTLTQRSDDRGDVIRERLKVYHEQTAPLVQYYEEEGVLTSIDGTQGPEAVFDVIMQTL